MGHPVRVWETPENAFSVKGFPQKKVLSLVLCLAVMLSVMVVGAGAAFSDQDKIENTEAVDACSALNIINGYEDGAFHPERNIKRAEVTKMICVALNGGEEPNTSTNAKPTFTDVRGTIYAWAEGYIEACVAQGIVDGVGGTRFAPAGNVTAAQLAKMLLVSLGYNATTEKFTGNAWETNVNVRASQKHLYDGLEKMDTSAAVTRDQAAQMVWNALQAYEVEYKDGVVQDKVVGNNRDKISLLEDKYEAWTNIGTLSNIDGKKLTITMNADDKAASDYVIKNTDGSTADDVTFSDLKANYSSMLGQKVKVLFKKGKLNDVIGVYPTDDNNVLINTTASALDTVSGETKIKVGDTKYAVDSDGLAVWTINVKNGAGELKKDDDVVKTAPEIAKRIDEINDNDMAVTVISNDNDNKVDVILVMNETFAKLTTVNSSSVSYKVVDDNMKGDTTGAAVKLDLATDEPVLYDKYAKNDYVFVGADLYNDNLVISKAKTVSGTCKSFKSDAINLDGTWYDYVLGSGKTYTAKANKTYTAYVYGAYAYYLTGEAGSNSDVDTLLVKTVGDYNAMNGGKDAKVYFEDGKDATVINVTKVVTPKTGFDLNDWSKDISDVDAAGKWTTEQGQSINTTLSGNTLYAYEKDGSDYILFALNTDFKAGDVKVLASGGTVSYNDKSETINSFEAESGAPIYLQYSTDNYKVITGSALLGYDGMAGTGNSVVLADKDNVVAAYINLGSSGISSTNTLYGVVKKVYKGSESNGTDTVVYLDLITAEGAKTVETEKTNYDGLSKGDIISFTGSYEKANDDIAIVSDTQTPGSAASQGYVAIDTYNDTSKLVRAYQNLYFNGTNDKYNVGAGKIVADSTVIYIDENGYVVEDATPSAAEELSGGNGYYANAFMIVNADNEIDLLVYESNNRIKDGSNKEVTLTKAVTKEATKVPAGSNHGAVKNLPDGVYNPTDTKFADANDVAGEASDNVIIKFTNKKENASTKLEIKKASGTTIYAETISGFTPANKGHFFYLNKFDPSVSSSRLTEAMVAGQTYSYTIVEDGTTIASGYFTA